MALEIIAKMLSSPFETLKSMKEKLLIFANFEKFDSIFFLELWQNHPNEQIQELTNLIFDKENEFILR